MPGYPSTFTRYTPRYAPYPAYRPVVYGYGHHHSHHSFGFGFGFGFYGGCVAYPTYPLVYYPSYYSAYPVYGYPETPYVQSVVVTEPAYVPAPAVSYYPSGTAAGYSTYAGAGYAGVTSPEVSYAPQVQYEYPPQEAAPVAPEATYEPADTSTSAAPAQVGVYGGRQEIVEPDVTYESADTGIALQQPAAPQSGGPKTIEVPTASTDPQWNDTAADTTLAVPEGARTSAEPMASSAVPTEPAIPAEQLHQKMVDGTEAFASGEYAASARLFAEVAQADPQNVDAALAYAVACFATGDYRAAAASIRNGVNLFPPIVDSTFDLRERYGKAEDFAAHLQKLERAAADKANRDARLVLGFVQHFSDQRDLSNPIFEEIAKQGGPDADLAEVFLNALSPEAAAEAAQQILQQPAPAEASPAPAPTAPAITAVVTTQPASVATTRPAGIDAVRGAPADANVLSVPTSQPAQAAPKLTGEVVYEGRLSLQTADTPREVESVDGLKIRLKSTDDEPPEAYLEVLVGDLRMKIKRFRPGATVRVKGASGRTYQLALVSVDNTTETVALRISK